MFVVALFCCLFCFCFTSLLSKASREELLVSLQFFCFIIYFLLAFHHHFFKLLNKSFFFPCGFNVFLHVSFLLSIIAFQSFERGARSLLASSSFWFVFFVDNISVDFFNLVYIIMLLLFQGSCSWFFTLHLSSFLCFYSSILFFLF